MHWVSDQREDHARVEVMGRGDEASALLLAMEVETLLGREQVVVLDVRRVVGEYGALLADALSRVVSRPQLLHVEGGGAAGLEIAAALEADRLPPALVAWGCELAEHARELQRRCAGLSDRYGSARAAWEAVRPERAVRRGTPPRPPSARSPQPPSRRASAD